MNAKKSMPNFETVDDYIDSQKIEAQIVLKELRQLIHIAVPEVLEMTNYKVPAFILVPGMKPDLQIMMAAYANHVSFYPFPATIAHFAEPLRAYKTGKGSVNFSYNEPLPKELILNMIRYREEEIRRQHSPIS